MKYEKEPPAGGTNQAPQTPRQRKQSQLLGPIGVVICIIVLIAALIVIFV